MINLTNAHITAYVNDVSRTIGEIFVDTTDELPTKNGIEGYELVQGSVAYVIHTGELYVMDGDGVWYSPDGEAIS